MAYRLRIPKDGAAPMMTGAGAPAAKTNDILPSLSSPVAHLSCGLLSTRSIQQAYSKACVGADIH